MASPIGVFERSRICEKHSELSLGFISLSQNMWSNLFTDIKLWVPEASFTIWEACNYLALLVTEWSMRTSLWPQSRRCPPNPAFMNYEGGILPSIFMIIAPVSQMVTKLAKRKSFYLLVLWNLNWTLCWTVAQFQSGREGICIASMAGPITIFLRKIQENGLYL